MAAPNMDQFESYFQRADADRDGRVSGNEAVAFFQATNLPKQVLAQIWNYADQNRTGFLGRPEFYNALKLVTVAQSKRDLTPELVKAALYGPASAKIPAPQINLAALPGPQPNVNASPVQVSGSPTSNQNIRPSGSLGFPAQQSQIVRPPRPPAPSAGLPSQMGVSPQVMPGTNSLSVPQPRGSSTLPGRNDGSQGGVSSQVSSRSLNPATQGGFGPVASPNTQPKSTDTVSLGSQVGKEEPKSSSVKGNGFTSDSVFGDVFSATPSQPKQNSSALTYSAGSLPASSTVTPTSSKDQPTFKPTAVSQAPSIPAQQFQSAVRPNQNVMAPNSAVSSVAGGNLASAQSQHPWPRMMQSDVQKYSKVFVQVDTDRDGKITGEQARNLFLSWRLPREVLKQVWDLSDQDNDSMLSLREFCIALYLMERYREGRPLPAVLPNSIMLDGISLPSSGQPAAGYVNSSWRPPPGPVQPQGPRNARTVTSAGGGRPPRPVPVPEPDEPVRQKAKVPVLEKHLVDQLSSGEQESLNKKLEEAKDADKKVADLEKDITEAKQKIQFYHAKMQELILYKSRCDSRLNEITERVVGDKREAESLAKKYEEKYKQAGDVASKLTIEEATFRDIQEKKMELYRAIVKLEQENADDIQDRANKLQSDLEELVKALNERCKTYGLRGKPTSLVELPFGWQPGIGGDAADWDETWDKFEEEGFSFAKELTLDVQNVVAPPKPKTPLIREKPTHLDNGHIANPPSEAHEKSDLSNKSAENEKPNDHDSEQTSRRSPDSPAGRDAVESPSKGLRPVRTKDIFANGSAYEFDIHSEHGGAEFMDKGFDEPAWGSFDAHYDADAAWDVNPVTPKDGEREKHSEDSLFDGSSWGLNPIKTGVTKQGPFFDSVPSTPLYNAPNLEPKTGPFFDSVPSTPLYNAGGSELKTSSFFDSVPSTPQYNAGGSDLKTSSFFDSVPSTPSYNVGGSDPKMSSFFDSVPSTPLHNSSGSPNANSMFTRNSIFADSVPSTPMYNSGASPRRFSEGSEDQYSFDSFSRFDSFNLHDSGPFSSRETLTRFDSMRSTRDSDFDSGYFGQQDASLARFDSFRSTADSDYNFGGPFPPQSSFSRFDSMRSTRDSDFGQSFPSFDDPADPFGSGEPFKTSHEAQTPRKDSDSWKAF